MFLLKNNNNNFQIYDLWSPCNINNTNSYSFLILNSSWCIKSYDVFLYFYKLTLNIKKIVYVIYELSNFISRI